MAYTKEVPWRPEIPSPPAAPNALTAYSQGGGYLGGSRGDGYNLWDPYRRRRVMGPGMAQPRNAMFSGDQGMHGGMQAPPNAQMSNAQMGYSNWGDKYGLNPYLADMSRQFLNSQGDSERAALTGLRAQYGADPSSYGFAALQSQIGSNTAFTNNALRARADASGRVMDLNMKKDYAQYEHDLNKPEWYDYAAGLGGAALGGWASGGFANPFGKKKQG